VERQEIILHVTNIFKDVLDNDDIILTDDTTAKDVDDWDSLNHIQSWNNVGELINSIAAKL
jgi:acyl carrier protein